MSDHLIKKRILPLVGRIDSEYINSILSKMIILRSESSDPITILIDSGGGNLPPALKLGDFISFLLGCPTRGIVIGDCMSAAMVVLCSCCERAALPHAKFLMHYVSKNNISFDLGPSFLTEVDDLVKESNSLMRSLEKFYAHRLGKNIDDIQKMMARGDKKYDCFLSAEEALEEGIISDIINVPLAIF